MRMFCYIDFIIRLLIRSELYMENENDTIEKFWSEKFILWLSFLCPIFLLGSGEFFNCTGFEGYFDLLYCALYRSFSLFQSILFYSNIFVHIYTFWLRKTLLYFILFVLEIDIINKFFLINFFILCWRYKCKFLIFNIEALAILYDIRERSTLCDSTYSFFQTLKNNISYSRISYFVFFYSTPIVFFPIFYCILVDYATPLYSTMFASLFILSRSSSAFHFSLPSSFTFQFSLFLSASRFVSFIPSHIFLYFHLFLPFFSFFSYFFQSIYLSCLNSSLLDLVIIAYSKKDLREFF